MRAQSAPQKLRLHSCRSQFGKRRTREQVTSLESNSGHPVTGFRPAKKCAPSARFFCTYHLRPHIRILDLSDPDDQRPSLRDRKFIRRATRTPMQGRREFRSGFFRSGRPPDAPLEDTTDPTRGGTLLVRSAACVALTNRVREVIGVSVRCLLILMTTPPEENLSAVNHPLMKSRISLLVALATLIGSATAAQAVPIAYTFNCPPESSDDTFDFSQFTAFSYTGRLYSGCMGGDNDQPKTYTMEFRCDTPPTNHFDLNGGNETPDNTCNVPDGGSSVSLLGATLLGFVAIRRRRAKV
jgi:hypothetical protein